jgi:hypothetical protein
MALYCTSLRIDGASMSAYHFLELKKIPRVRLLAD